MVVKKIVAHLKWFFAVIPLGLIAIITSPIMVIPAWFFAFLGKYNPFWFWLDDEILSEESNADWLIYKESKGMFAWYIWHAFRNSMWNAKELLKPENARLNCKYNNEEIHQIIYNDLTNDGKPISIHGDCISMAGYKWIDKNGNEGWQVFSGDYVSKKYSIIGRSVLWYYANDKLYYRHSVAKEIMLFGKKYYFEFKMGASEKRYLLILKLKKCKNYISQKKNF